MNHRSLTHNVIIFRGSLENKLHQSFLQLCDQKAEHQIRDKVKPGDMLVHCSIPSLV